LISIKDTIKILPNNFNQKFEDGLMSELNSKYSNKILTNYGLCVSVFDFEEIGDPYLIPNEGGTILLN
jgi:DNA-directed RNA polymerase III subunit RPC8